jgi:transcriptional regulator with XRE-family HTH domain
VDDYQSDIHFGEWLRKVREQKGLTIERAAREAMIEASRLRALEVGYAERGITRPEATRLSTAYQITLDDLLLQAQGK